MADSKDETTEAPVAAEVEDVEEVGGGDEGAHDEAAGMQAILTSQLLKNPEVLANLQGRLEGMLGQASGYIESLPKPVKRRLKALKKLQFEATKIEARFYEEVHELECKYAAKYAPLNEKRKDIVSGSVEPTDSDCDWESDTEKDEDAELADGVKTKVTIEDEKKPEDKEAEEEEEAVAGVPQFWSTAFKNVDMLASMIQEHDEPILHHLIDVKVKFLQADPMGFVLEFHFEPNDYFTNSVLTKTYYMKSEPDESDPFGFEGPEIIRCKGCSIDWKKDKNVTVKLVKKKQKHKGRGQTRVVTKQVQQDSFFNFFNPPEVPEAEDYEVDEDTEELLAADFEIGHFIRERIVPRAVLYFTGEALEDEDYEEEEEEDDEEVDPNKSDDEENDPDYKPNPNDKPAECKQQ